MSKHVHSVYYTKRVNPITEHNFYLDTAIEYPEVYREMIDVLLTAPKQDVINIYLNTPGGSCSIGINIVNAIRNCEAHVVGHLMSECHSMGTFILLECDEFVVNEDIVLLFHAYSGWNWGKGTDSVTAAEMNHKWLSTFFKKVYFPFFTEDEIAKIMPEDGSGATDMYLFYDDMVERLQRVQEYRAEKAQKEQDTVDALLAKALGDDEDDSIQESGQVSSEPVCEDGSVESETTEEHNDS